MDGAVFKRVENGAIHTFKVKRFVPSRVERAPLDLRLEPVLLVREERDAHVRVGRARQVLRRQILALRKSNKTRTYTHIERQAREGATQ